MGFLFFVAVVFSVFLVGMYSYFSFNTTTYKYCENAGLVNSKFRVRAMPGLPDNMTVRSRYRIFAALFSVFAISEWLLITLFLPVFPGINTLVNIKGADKTMTYSVMALLSALVLMGLVHYLQWPRQLLFEYAKKWFHKFACIPERGCIVYNDICTSSIDYKSEAAKANIRQLLKSSPLTACAKRQDLFAKDFINGKVQHLLWKWAVLSYAFHVIDAWSMDSKFSSQIKRPSLMWGAIYDNYIETIEMIIKYRRGLLEQDEIKRLNVTVESLLANCYRLISSVVLRVARSNEDPLEYLRKAGYKVVAKEKFLPEKNLIFRIILVLIPTFALFGITCTMIPGAHVETVPKIIRDFFCSLIIMVLPIYMTLSVKSHLVMKESWPNVIQKGPYHSFFDMPLGLYATVSFLAWATSMALSMLYLHHDELRNIAIWKYMAVFNMVSACMAFLTAYWADTVPKIYKSQVSLFLGRLKGPFYMGSVTAGLVWVGLKMLPASSLALPGAEDYSKYPFMAFALAAIIRFNLFHSKHKLDNRSSPRDASSEVVKVFVGENTGDMILVDKSRDGMQAVSKKEFDLYRGDHIDVVLDKVRRHGSVVEAKGRHVHIQFQD